MHIPNLDALSLLTKAELIAIIKKMLINASAIDAMYNKGSFNEN